VRTLLRLILVLIIIVAAAAFFVGWWGGGRTHRADHPDSTIGTAGRIDTSNAERVGAEVGQKTADAANRAAEALSDGALTAKIKSKMALDDTVRARAVDVSTSDHVVTLSGVVRSQAERDRVLQLARETSGVTRVVDNVSIR
jgi:hyperosmotically inducible periplasmic protein